MQTIYLNRDNPAEVKIEPLWWQEQGLQYTASGYGAKIPMQYKAFVSGKFRRVYCKIYSNSGTCFIMLGKQKQNIDF